MTTNRVYHLSNLAAGQEFDLTVAEGSDVLAAAQSHLEESGLDGALQHGFYLSVYPRDPDGDAPDHVSSIVGNDENAPEAGSIDDAAILA